MFAAVLSLVGQVVNSIIGVFIQLQTASGIPFLYIVFGGIVVKLVVSALASFGGGDNKSE